MPRSTIGRSTRFGTRLALLSMIAAAPMVGCVSQAEYDDTRAAAESLESRTAQLQAELEAARRLAERRQETIAGLQTSIVEKDRELARLRERLASLNARIDSLADDMQNLPMGGMIDAQTDAALRQLAAENPSLFSYDPETGTIRVSADVTFSSGSADVQQAAREALGELARILAGAIDDRYDIRVVGHTDSQRMSNPATIRRFGDNRGLSVARAISVSDALQAAGLPAPRIETSGWGPHRPQVANNPTGGTRENRRVEILIVPTTFDRPLTPAAAPEQETRQDNTPARRDFPVK